VRVGGALTFPIVGRRRYKRLRCGLRDVHRSLTSNESRCEIASFRVFAVPPFRSGYERLTTTYHSSGLEVTQSYLRETVR